jgi:uncharacterized protein
MRQTTDLAGTGWFVVVRSLRVATAFVLYAVLAGAAAPLAQAQRFDHGLLWRIEGKGAAASHVFGTVHVADPRVTNLPAPVVRELRDARSLTVEIGFAPANVMQLANRMVYLDGRDLPAVAGAELYAKTAALATKLGLPEPALRLFKPWAVALLLSVPQQNPDEVLDHVLARTAAGQGKPVRELETVDEQLAAFEDMPVADQTALLRRAVENYERQPRTLGRVIEAYLARDLAAMWRIGAEESASGADARQLNEIFVRRLLHERNARMIERMESELAQGRAFVAIGALHLYGERGVLAGLERRGWRVTRVY